MKHMGAVRATAPGTGNRVAPRQLQVRSVTLPAFDWLSTPDGTSLYNTWDYCSCNFTLWTVNSALRAVGKACAGGAKRCVPCSEELEQQMEG